MNRHTRNYKRRRHNLIVVIMVIIVVIIVSVLIDILLAYSAVYKYIDVRYNFSPDNVETNFKERYGYFTDELRDSIAPEEQEEIIRQVHNNQLVSRLESYDISLLKYNAGYSIFKVSIKAGYYDNDIEISSYEYSFITTIEHRMLFKHLIQNIELLNDVHDH